MEIPSSSHLAGNHESIQDTAKAFLDSERGNNTNDHFARIKGNEKDIFISEQSENDFKSSNVHETLKAANLNGNAIERNEHVQSDISNEKDKFINSRFVKTDGTSSMEDQKFRNNETHKESTNKNIEINENVDDNKNCERESEEKDEIKHIITSSINENDSKPGSSKTKEDKENNEEWMDILGSGQLKKKTLKQGIPGSRPQKSDVCEISIIGKLEDGTIFEENKCLELNLGDNETVQGLDFVLALMDKEEQAEVIVASRFGYGSLGYKPHIPPDATLYYQITLLNVKQEPLISTLDINERIVVGSRKKERGNWWYSRDEHTLAIHSYRRALDYLDDTDIPGEHIDEQIRLLIDERLKTYNNLGISQMKISAYDAALISIDHVLNCQPKNVKGLFRKSKIFKEKGELSKSIEVLREALSIEPDSKSLQQELCLLLAAQRKDNSKQRDLYKKMMGNTLQDNESDKNKKKPYNSFKIIAVVSFAVAIIGGAIAFKYRL